MSKLIYFTKWLQSITPRSELSCLKVCTLCWHRHSFIINLYYYMYALSSLSLPHPHLLPFNLLHRFVSFTSHPAARSRHPQSHIQIKTVPQTEKHTAVLSGLLLLIYSYLLPVKYKWQKFTRLFCCRGSTHTTIQKNRTSQKYILVTRVHTFLCIAEFLIRKKVVGLLKCRGEKAAALSRMRRNAWNVSVNQI